jgi:hypothetical protein
VRRDDGGAAVSAGKAPRRFPPGTHVRDAESGNDGILMAYMDAGDPWDILPGKRKGRRAYLRPIGGGREWEADPDALEPFT